MNLDNILHFGIDYLIPFMGLPLLGVIVGAWLTNSFFPFRLKRREWRWEKELWAKERLFETVSQVSFIAEHYLKGERDDHFSMSGLGIVEAEHEIMKLIKGLHAEGYKIRLYLNKSDAQLFEKYLADSQDGYDGDKESWGHWGEGDEVSEILHIEGSISWQGKLAKKVLEEFN
ncbi:hypothetical protein C4K68_01915 [Pokkaliibacter plantistimulans]|uniref:Uncharacterized protein n=1 Tax=Proteobacteria bacterium 228 TaxID=2083153 RepID=A0A2S5KWI3_9PROT|nr:hypothetical protein [Pokkaliibacter plantistimulans]PPC79078.1 hypothetical protein C4K68_01915 [Pokkaliibacter plantistimulans]